MREGNPYMEEQDALRGKDVDEDDMTVQENTNIRTVEILWNGFVEKVQFTLPDEWASLSDATKMQYIANVDLSNAESRSKSLVEKHMELYDEICHQDRLSRSPIYRLLAKNYVNLKKFVYTIVVALNFNIMMSPFESLEEVNIYEDVAASHLTTGEMITVVLGMTALCGYGICLLYLGIR